MTELVKQRRSPIRLSIILYSQIFGEFLSCGKDSCHACNIIPVINQAWPICDESVNCVVEKEKRGDGKHISGVSQNHKFEVWKIWKFVLFE